MTVEVKVFDLSKFEFPQPEAFREWLAEYHPEEVVGFTRKNDDCPLYYFLTHIDAIPDIAKVGSKVLFIDEEHVKVIRLPEWAERFIEMIDVPEVEELESEPVTARQALSTLNQITAGEEDEEAQNS
jgi:hypothetical protein